LWFTIGKGSDQLIPTGVLHDWEALLMIPMMCLGQIRLSDLTSLLHIQFPRPVVGLDNHDRLGQFLNAETANIRTSRNNWHHGDNRVSVR
jgi:hypothetical protein